MAKIILKYTLLFLVFSFNLILAEVSEDIEYKKKLRIKLKSDTTALDSLKTFSKFVLIFSKTNLDSAIYYYNRALPLIKRANNPKSQSKIYERLANAYWYGNNFKTAMEFYLKQLRIGDSLNDDAIIASCKYNIGWIKCLQLKQFKNVNYLYDALKISSKLNDTDQICNLYIAFGGYYYVFKDKYKYASDSSLKYYYKCISLQLNSTFKNTLSATYANLAQYYQDNNDFINAKKISLKGCAEALKDSDDFSYVANACVLASSYVNLDSTQKALDVLQSYSKYLSQPSLETIRLDTYKIYYTLYQKQKNFEKAFEYSLKYKDLSDSINEKTFNQNLLQKESDYKLEKKDKELNELLLKNQLQTVKNKHNSYIILGLIIFGILVLIILYFLFKSNKQKHQTNKLLSSQNGIINEKNKEIHQSMQYASRIQHALMPTQKYISSNLNRLKKK